MTYPLIGNYGRVRYDDQSERPWLRGLIVANATAAVLDDARQLATMLREAGIPAIAGVDTRALARHLRSSGSLRAIVTAPGETDPEEARALARERAPLGGPGLRGRRSRRWPRATRATRPRAARWSRSSTSASRRTSCAAFAGAGARVRILPHTATAAEALAPDVDGVVFSPGPGDPARLDGPVALARAGRSPTAARCWASAWATRSSAGPPAPSTRRLPFGHHAANHPVKDLETGLVQVTAQNHEVTVIAETLPAASGFVVSQIDLNDGSVEGLRHRTLPIETVQYHPEGGPGPLDALAVFDRFVAAARARHGGAAPEADGRQGRAAPPGHGRAGEATAGYGVTESGRLPVRAVACLGRRWRSCATLCYMPLESRS